MKRRFLFPALLLLAPVSFALAENVPLVTNDSAPAFTRFLEDQPLHPLAKGLRASMLEWEDKSKDVVDVVCPGVLSPLPADDIKYSSELLAQFIFGSAAYQLDHPSEKGKLQPTQLAGIISLLRAYKSFIAKDPSAKIPRLDELSAAVSDGSIESIMTPLVEKECSRK